MTSLYAFKIAMSWTREIREFVFQDETRKVGTAPTRSWFCVVAPSEEIALAWAKANFRYVGEYKEPKTYKVEDKWPVAGALVEPSFQVESGYLQECALDAGAKEGGDDG